jgi:hypothetical protein
VSYVWAASVYVYAGVTLLLSWLEPSPEMKDYMNVVTDMTRGILPKYLEGK